MNTFYIKAFANNQINGNQLLSLRPYELEELGIISIGHQEVILEAVEHLRNFVSLVLYQFLTGSAMMMIHLSIFIFSIIIWTEKIYSIWHYKSVP